MASTLIKEGVMIEKMNVSNMSLENYYFSLIKGVENNVLILLVLIYIN